MIAQLSRRAVSRVPETSPAFIAHWPWLPYQGGSKTSPGRSAFWATLSALNLVLSTQARVTLRQIRSALPGAFWGATLYSLYLRTRAHTHVRINEIVYVS